MRTAAYKADVAGAGMWQDTFFVSCRKERTVRPQKTAHEDGYDGIRGTESVMLVNTYKKQR